MTTKLHVEGFDAAMSAISDNSGKTIFVLFSGSRDSGGHSWCPDCVSAEPVIDECLTNAPADSVFIHCGVGERAFWKDKSNIFRTHEKLRLTSVPTLIKWGTKQRLEEAECSKKDLVEMMFEDA